jgi:uncharacterized phage infection (PIP) family protein YhgE
MADIHIQKKEGPPILPILLGLLALGAVIAIVLLFTGNDRDDVATSPGVLPYDTAGEAMTTAQTDAAVPAEVRSYREQCGSASQFRDEMAAEHEFEANCMRLLADGLDAVVMRETVADQPLQQRVEALKQRAQQITEDRQATDHANRVRGAADEATAIVEYLAANRETAGAGLQQHAQQMRQAADRIDRSTVLLEQQERTSEFFSRSADALEALAQSRQGQPR